MSSLCLFFVFCIFCLGMQPLVGDAPLTKDEATLLAAVKRNEVEVVSALLNEGVSPNIKNENNTTPLHHASENGFVQVVSILLEHKANVSAEGDLGFTPLHGAALRGHVEIVSLLLAAGAGAVADFRDKYGKTALDFALKNNDHIIYDLIHPHTTFDWAIQLESKEALSCIVISAAVLISLVYWVNSAKSRTVTGGQRARSISMESKRQKRKNGKLH